MLQAQLGLGVRWMLSGIGFPGLPAVHCPVWSADAETTGLAAGVAGALGEWGGRAEGSLGVMTSRSGFAGAGCGHREEEALSLVMLAWTRSSSGDGLGVALGSRVTALS